MLQELEVGRIAAALAEMQRSRVAFRVLERPSPFAFPLIIERLRERISTAKLSDRVARMSRIDLTPAETTVIGQLPRIPRSADSSKVSLALR